VRGLVIHNQTLGVEVIKQHYDASLNQQAVQSQADTRWQKVDEEASNHRPVSNQQKSATDQEDSSKTLVEIQSGTPLGAAINQLHSLGLTGLESFARIPGTIGGEWSIIFKGEIFFLEN